jgi:tetratricopeptide (TPR) repeat protein
VSSTTIQPQSTVSATTSPPESQTPPTKTPDNDNNPPKDNSKPATAATSTAVTKAPEADAPISVEPPDKRGAISIAERKTRLARLSDSVSAIRGIVTNLLVLILLVVIFAALVAEVRRQSVVIDPIILPKEVIDSGWSPDDVSQRLNDKVHNIVNRNGLKYSSSQIEIKRQFIKERGEKPDFQVPGSGVSMSTLVHYAKDWLGFPETHFGGNISREGDSLQFVLRNNNQNIPVAILKEAKLEDLLDRAAEEIVKSEVPHQLAFYLFFEEKEKRTQRMRYKQPEPEGGDYQRTLNAVSYTLSRNQPDGNSWAYLIWGLILADEQKPDEAIKKYELAVAARPKFSAAYYYWGNALRDLGKYDEAIAKYTKTIELDPADAATITDWGNTLEMREQHEEAIERYKKALEYAPNEAVLYNNWCNSLNGLGKHDEAIEKCKQAITLDANYALAYHNWGVALERLGRYEEALAQYKHAATIDPERTKYCEGWQNALNYLGRDPKTDAEFQKTCNQKPNI